MSKIELSRRLLMQKLAAASGAFAVPATVANSAAAQVQTKASPQAAGYQNTPSGGNRCGNCQQFQAPAACRIVSGRINSQGWCRLFFPKTS
jgi:hypothetical protein